MGAYTSGPWLVVEGPPSRLSHSGVSFGPGGTVFVQEGTRALVVACYTWSMENARLIAAAPELLDAALRVTRLYDFGDELPPDHPIVFVRAAIAKAEG